MRHLSLFIVLMFCVTSASFAFEVNGGINGQGQLSIDCTIEDKGPRYDQGKDLSYFIDGVQNNALGESEYIEKVFPKCRTGMNCPAGREYMTRSNFGYFNRNIFSVKCDLDNFENGSNQVDRAIYKNPPFKINETCTSYGDVESDAECKGVTGVVYQGGAFKQFKIQKKEPVYKQPGVCELQPDDEPTETDEVQSTDSESGEESLLSNIQNNFNINLNNWLAHSKKISTRADCLKKDGTWHIGTCIGGSGGTTQESCSNNQGTWYYGYCLGGSGGGETNESTCETNGGLWTDTNPVVDAYNINETGVIYLLDSESNVVYKSYKYSNDNTVYTEWSNIADTLKKVRKIGTGNNTDPDSFYFYKNDDHYTRDDVKYDLKGIRLNLLDDESLMAVTKEGCLNPGSICQEGVYFVFRPAVKQTNIMNIKGNAQLKFLIVVRNQGSNNTSNFKVRLEAQLSLKKLEDDSIIYELENESIAGDATGVVNATVQDPIKIEDMPDLSCGLSFSGEGIDSRILEIGADNVPTYKVDSLGPFAIRPRISGVTVPDYMKFPNRDDVTFKNEAIRAAGDSFENINGEVKLEEIDVIYAGSADVKLGVVEKLDVMCDKVNFKVPAKANTIGLKPFSNCGLFTALRDYYLKNDSTDYLQYPNMEIATLPPRKAPFMGLYNIAQWDYHSSTNGVSKNKARSIEFSSSTPVMPEIIAQRRFKKTYVVVRLFTDQGITLPVMYGELGENSDFRQVELKSVSDFDTSTILAVEGEEGVEKESEPLVVVEIIAKGSIDENAGFEQESERFISYQGHDFNLAFAGGSCLSKMPFMLPVKKDGSDSVRLPSEIDNLPLCKYSIPVKYRDLIKGKAMFNVVAIVPKSRLHTYPVELMMAGAQAQSCSSNSDGEKISCWEIKSYLPPTMSDRPLKNHSDCHETVCKQVTAKVPYACGRYLRDTCYSDVPREICVDKFKDSCNVLETDSKNECNSNMAFRFDGYFSQMVAALGCVQKYDSPIENEHIQDENGETVSLSGVTVAGTLRGEGIIPYKETNNTEVVGIDTQNASEETLQVRMGGSAPKSYTEYNNTKIQRSRSGDNKLGYACVPCQFNLPWLKGSFNVSKLPVDQNSLDAPRTPAYTFHKKEQASSCVKETEFEVRYFGSDRCNGENKPDGHFCDSRNLEPVKCPVTGGNIAGSFSIPLCAGSHFGTSRVSASWSPILIDVIGDGIKVSRSSDHAVEFDMKNEGKKMLVDWPHNSNNVAFLVEPNKDGQVTSVDQLFGDYGFKDGFDKLVKKYDSDKNGRINNKDKNYKKLKLWFDYDRNGVSDAGEIQDLVDHGVNEINLRYTRSGGRGLASHSLTSTYWNDKKQRYMNVVDVYFGAHMYRSTGEKLPVFHKVKKNKKTKIKVK